MHQKGRRRPERNQVRQRIEFPAKGALHPAHPRQPAIEQIKNARQQNKGQRHLDFRVYPAGPILASTILVSATKPQNKLPAVIKFGRK